MENRSLIEARKVSYLIGEKRLLVDLSLNVRSGEVLAVLGANGAGKSTLRKILSGDLTPVSGAVSMNNRPLAELTLKERACARAVLPQDSSLNFPFTILEVVLMGRAPHLEGAENRRDYEIARKALESVEAAHLAERLYPTLSGGERQRVQFARVLAQIWEPSKSGETRFLLLDEPTTSLDLAHQYLTLEIARRFARSGVGVLIILHDLNLAAQFADQILLLKNGKVIARGTPAETLTESLISEVFDISVVLMQHPHLKCPLIIPSVNNRQRGDLFDNSAK